jgi:hypothetical protein
MGNKDPGTRHALGKRGWGARYPGARYPLETNRRSTAAAALAKDVGFLALALEQAAAFINKQGLSFSEYRERWQHEDAAVRSWFDDRLMRYPRSVATTWETSFAELDEDARAAAPALLAFHRAGATRAFPHWRGCGHRARAAERGQGQTAPGVERARRLHAHPSLRR